MAHAINISLQSEPQHVQDALLPSINNGVSISHCLWVKLEGRTIKSNCYIITGSDGLHPTFSKVINIMVIADIVVLQVVFTNVQYFDGHYHAYVTENLVEKSYMNYTELFDRSILYPHTKNDTIYVYLRTTSMFCKITHISNYSFCIVLYCRLMHCFTNICD